MKITSVAGGTLRKGRIPNPDDGVEELTAYVVNPGNPPKESSAMSKGKSTVSRGEDGKFKKSGSNAKGKGKKGKGRRKNPENAPAKPQVKLNAMEKELVQMKEPQSLIKPVLVGSGALMAPGLVMSLIPKDMKAKAIQMFGSGEKAQFALDLGVTVAMWLGRKKSKTIKKYEVPIFMGLGLRLVQDGIRAFMPKDKKWAQNVRNWAGAGASVTHASTTLANGARVRGAAYTDPQGQVRIDRSGVMENTFGDMEPVPGAAVHRDDPRMVAHYDDGVVQNAGYDGQQGQYPQSGYGGQYDQGVGYGYDQGYDGQQGQYPQGGYYQGGQAAGNGQAPAGGQWGQPVDYDGGADVNFVDDSGIGNWSHVRPNRIKPSAPVSSGPIQVGILI